MTDQQARELIEKYNLGLATEQEAALLQHWFIHEGTAGGEVFSDQDREVLGQQIWQELEVRTKPVKVRLWPRIAVAASVAVVLGIGAYLFVNNRALKAPATRSYATDIAPGRNSATLTLADGAKIVLAQAAEGKLADQGGASVSKTGDGTLVYEGGAAGGSELKMNMLSTSRGEQYQVTLPDGTRVWLNAASSLKYPASFSGSKFRRVELSGEGYFEVAKDKSHPFVVKSAAQEVLVLGTHFNVSAYGDEAVTRTTLLEGSVNVVPLIGKSGLNADLVGRVLVPGDQALLGSSGDVAVQQVNVNKMVAWKNGRFVFENDRIEDIMRVLSRWYDVEVVYEGDVRDIAFMVSVSRYDHISRILDKIAFTKKVHFKVEGRRVTVMR